MKPSDPSSTSERTTAEFVEMMRADWNGRATEDARFYIACGRREETEAEFRENAKEVVRRIRRDLHWLSGDRSTNKRRFLEIGCGIGRLMAHLAQDCGEIHGVDISDEMIARSKTFLGRVSHAYTHVAAESDLREFASSSFDLVYSYAVFQHLPAEQFFWRYLDEIFRVLVPGGILVLQFNGTDDNSFVFDTWAGVRVLSSKVTAACQIAGCRIRSLEGQNTQYVWITAQKVEDHEPSLSGLLKIDEIVGADDALDTLVARGPDGFLSVYVKDLPLPFCDISELSIDVGGVSTLPDYVGGADERGRRQINAYLPPDVPVGPSQIVLKWRTKQISEPYPVRVVPPRPAVPRILALADGVELRRLNFVKCGWAKLWMVDVEDSSKLAIVIGGLPTPEFVVHCEDERTRRYQVNVRIPDGLPAGGTILVARVGNVSLPSVEFVLIRN